MAYVVFLGLLLVVVVYLNRDLIGLGSGKCQWTASDEALPGQPRKWLCMQHGTVMELPEGEVPKVQCEDLNEQR